jgi:hypothetical protein
VIELLESSEDLREMNDPITTRYRQPIPMGLAYPVGSEVISLALKDVPQYAELSLSSGLG